MMIFLGSCMNDWVLGQSTTAGHATARTAEAAEEGGHEGDHDGHHEEDHPPGEEARVVASSASADDGALGCEGEVCYLGTTWNSILRFADMALYASLTWSSVWHWLP